MSIVHQPPQAALLYKQLRTALVRACTQTCQFCVTSGKLSKQLKIITFQGPVLPSLPTFLFPLQLTLVKVRATVRVSKSGSLHVSSLNSCRHIFKPFKGRMPIHPCIQVNINVWLTNSVWFERIPLHYIVSLTLTNFIPAVPLTMCLTKHWPLHLTFNPKSNQL